jgi:hypothetical protein
MGWSSSDDPLAQVELSFPSADAAIAYARRQGLPSTVLGVPQEVQCVTIDLDPRHVLQDPKLSLAEKRNLLHSWAFDAYRVELSRTKTKPVSSSRLSEVIDALIDLDQTSEGRDRVLDAKLKAA